MGALTFLKTFSTTSLNVAGERYKRRLSVNTRNQVEANLVTIVDIPGAKEGGADAEGKLGEGGRGDVIGRGGCELCDEEGEG